MALGILRETPFDSMARIPSTPCISRSRRSSSPSSDIAGLCADPRHRRRCGRIICWIRAYLQRRAKMIDLGCPGFRADAEGAATVAVSPSR